MIEDHADYNICNALAAVAYVLLNASCTHSSLALVSHDVCHTFDSLIQPLVLLRDVKRGVNPGIIRCQRDMYAKLRVRYQPNFRQNF
jgi:hypothetical protein